MSSRDKVVALPPVPQGGVVLRKGQPQEPPPMRRFSIVILGATDGFRLQLEPPQVGGGLSALEATAILARVAGAGLGPMQQVPPSPRPEDPSPDEPEPEGDGRP